jgi:predicted RNA-binding protein YlxR (DUF448 family)
MEPNHRRCVSCRRIAPKVEFWRVIRIYPSQAVQLDQGMGRSAYLCPNAACLKLAQQKNRLGRALKVTVPEPVYQELWLRLTASAQPATVGAAQSQELPVSPVGDRSGTTPSLD